MSEESKEYNIERIGYLWYEYGCKNREPSYVRFLAHWMAFNWLYSNFPGDDERSKIESFLNHYYSCIEANTDFNNPIYKPFFCKEVIDMKYKNSYWSKKNFQTLINPHQPMKDRINALFMTMYQVRCNLFHGQKNPESSRDRELVESTAIILEHYIGAIKAKKESSH